MATDWRRGDNLKEPCKLCGGILVIRQSSRDGGLFVGCRSFPSCKFNRPIRPGDKRDDTPWPPPAETRAAVHPDVAPLVDEIDDEDRDPFGSPAQTMELEAADPDMAAIEAAAEEAGVPRGDYDEPDELDEVVRNQHALGRSVADVFDGDCGQRIRVRISVEPVDADSDDVVLSDEFTAGFDLDRARARRAAMEPGNDAAVEIVGWLLQRLVDAVGRVID